jgi:hypothetical protein
MKARGQVFEAQRRHFAPAEFAAGKQATVAGNNLAVAIDQYWHIEVEGLDAVGNLLNLLFTMEPRVRGVRPELSDLPISNLQAISSLGSSLFGVVVLPCHGVRSSRCGMISAHHFAGNPRTARLQEPM